MPKKLILPLQSFSEEDKIRAMRLIDDNEGNISRAARALGISRQTLLRWRKQYWDVYEMSKPVVTEQVLSIEAKKMVMFDKTGELVNKSTELYEKLVNFYLDEQGDDNIRAMKHKDRVSLMKMISPFVMETKVVRGVKGVTPPQQNNFFGNIYNQLTANNNGNNSNKTERN